jgi:hypothetical protein
MTGRRSDWSKGPSVERHGMRRTVDVKLWLIVMVRYATNFGRIA